MTMKIPIKLLKTCPINSEIYRDSDVGDLVNSIGEVGLLQQSRWCKTSRQCWRFVCRFFNNKIIFTTLQVKSPHSCKLPPNRGIYCVLLNQPIRKPSETNTHNHLTLSALPSHSSTCCFPSNMGHFMRWSGGRLGNNWIHYWQPNNHIFFVY